jgi:putative inorganic carbon (HCO3(-)) transporter
MVGLEVDSARRRGRLLKFTIATVLALTPLLILPSYFFLYDVSPKIVVSLFGTAIAFLLYLADGKFAGLRWLYADPLGRWFCLLALAQIVWLLVSTLFGTHPALSWNGGNWRRLGFVCQSAVMVLAFLIAVSYSQSGLRVLLRACAAAGSLAALYGILQYFGVDPILSPAIYHVGEGVTAIVRPPSTLGNADYFAGYLLYVVFFGAGLAVTETKSAWKTLGAATAIVGSIAIVLSGTRGAMLALGAGIISLWIWRRPRLTGRLAAMVAGLGAIGLVFYLSPAGLKLRARSQWALEDLRGGARIWLWQDSLRMAGRRLLTGFGPDTFGLEFPRYQSVELSQAYPDFYHESPHNIFLDALVSEGIPGLTILVGFAVLAWFTARCAVNRGEHIAPYLAAALVSGLTSGFFVCFTLPGDLYFFATIALLAGLAMQRTTSLNGFRLVSEMRVAALTFGLITIAMFLYLALQVSAADVAAGRAKRDLEGGRLEDAASAYRFLQRWHPAGSSDDLYFSRLLEAVSHTAPSRPGALMASQEALRAAERAAETSEERQNAWYNLAAFYATRHDSASVEMCLRRSIEASPYWFKPHWALAQVLLLSGRKPEALAEAVRAADLDGGKDTEIAKFLQSIHQQTGSPKSE